MKHAYPFRPQRPMTPGQTAAALVDYIPVPRPWPNAIAPSKLDIWLPQHHLVHVAVVPGQWPRNPLNPHWSLEVRYRCMSLSPQRRRELAGPAREDAVRALYAWLMARCQLDPQATLDRISTITFRELAALVPPRRSGGGDRSPRRGRRLSYAAGLHRN